jgi:uncharacterized protein (DUF302 family)
MNEFERTFTTDRSFDTAVAAIQKKAAEKGFRVLQTHDVAATLAEKGFPREPLKIIEVCNAKYASQVLLDCRVFPESRYRGTGKGSRGHRPPDR